MCAQGGLYTVFADLSELVIHVNSTTLKALEAADATETRDRTPTDRLRKLAQGYLSFAVENRNLWKALFDHFPPETSPTPQWHLDEHLFLMDVIADPLAELQPDMPAEDRAIRPHPVRRRSRRRQHQSRRPLRRPCPPSVLRAR